MVQETTIAGLNAVLYKPDLITGKLPILVFLPGRGEQVGSISEMYTHGPLRFIKNGWKPNFMVVGFQAQQEWPNAIRVKQFLDGMKTTIPEIDLSKISLTGLSAGAGGIYNLFKAHPDYGIASVIPMSMAADPINAAAYSKTKVLGFCGSKDSWYLKMKSEITSIPGAKFYDIPTTVVHGDWNKVYDPAYKIDGKNIYELAIGADVTPPVEQPTTGKRIMLPVKTGGIYVKDAVASLGVKPGDTLVIPTGAHQAFLAGFFGVENEANVIIEHEDPNAVWGRAGNYIFSIENARHFTVKKIHLNAGPTHKGFNLACGKKASNYTIEDYSSQYGVNGIKASWNPDPADPATYSPNTINNVIIRRAKILDTETEGMYIGNTTAITAATNPVPARIKGLILEGIHTERTGWDGVQIANTGELAAKNITCVDYGLKNQSGQQAGVLIGGYVTVNGTIENIKTSNGSGAGLTIFGRGKIHVKNFELDNGLGGIYADDYTDGLMGLPVQELVFENGKITNTKGPLDIEVRNAKSTAKKTTYINVLAKTIKDNTGGVLTPPTKTIVKIVTTVHWSDGTTDVTTEVK